MSSYAVIPGVPLEELEETMNPAPEPVKAPDEPKPKRRPAAANDGKDS